MPTKPVKRMGKIRCFCGETAEVRENVRLKLYWFCGSCGIIAPNAAGGQQYIRDHMTADDPAAEPKPAAAPMPAPGRKPDKMSAEPAPAPKPEPKPAPRRSDSMAEELGL